MNRIEANEYRLWTKTRSPKDQDLFYTIDKNINRVKKQTDFFYEEEKQSKKALPKRQEKEIIKSNTMTEFPNISPTINKAIVKLNKQMKAINDSTTKISKVNSMYVNKRLFKNQDEEQVNEVETMESLKYKPNQDKNKFVSTGNSPVNKTPVIRNFNYIINKYHKQISRAFYRFNPQLHLTNLHMLSNIDPSIQEDVNNLKKTIDNDINKITDKHYHLKRYEQLKKKNLRQNKLQTLEISNNLVPQKRIFKNNSTPHLSRRSYNKILTSVKQKPAIIMNKLSLAYDLKKKRDTLAERQFKEINQLSKVAQSLHNIIESQNIITNIDKGMVDYKLKKKFLNLEETEDMSQEKDTSKINDTKDKIKIFNPFSSQFNKLNKMFGELHLYKTRLYDSRDIENVIIKKISQKNENLRIKQESIKDNFINDIKTQIKKAKLNIEI